jgi:hypothetical protein
MEDKAFSKPVISESAKIYFRNLHKQVDVRDNPVRYKTILGKSRTQSHHQYVRYSPLSGIK